MTTFQVELPRPAIGKRSHSGLGDEDGVADVALGDQGVELLAQAPGASCRSCAVSSTAPAVSAPVSRSTAQRLDGGRRAAFHVRGAAAGEEFALHGRRHERQMHRVEMAIELESSAGAPLSRRTTTAGAAG